LELFAKIRQTRKLVKLVEADCAVYQSGNDEMVARQSVKYLKNNPYIAVKELKKGDTLGYGSVCKAKKDARAIVAAVGFSHGFELIGAPDPLPLRDFGVYLYHLLQRWRNPVSVTWNGKRLMMLGRVGSQYTMFDATGLDIKPGDDITARVNLLQNTAGRKYL
jgi:alanine racemase